MIDINPTTDHHYSHGVWRLSIYADGRIDLRADTSADTPAPEPAVATEEHEPFGFLHYVGTPRQQNRPPSSIDLAQLYELLSAVLPNHTLIEAPVPAVPPAPEYDDYDYDYDEDAEDWS